MSSLTVVGASAHVLATHPGVVPVPALQFPSVPIYPEQSLFEVTTYEEQALLASTQFFPLVTHPDLKVLQSVSVVFPVPSEHFLALHVVSPDDAEQIPSEPL